MAAFMASSLYHVKWIVNLLAQTSGSDGWRDPWAVSLGVQFPFRADQPICAVTLYPAVMPRRRKQLKCNIKCPKTVSTENQQNQWGNLHTVRLRERRPRAAWGRRCEPLWGSGPWWGGSPPCSSNTVPDVWGRTGWNRMTAQRWSELWRSKRSEIRFCETQRKSGPVR